MSKQSSENYIDSLKMISHMIKMALGQKITWETLESFLKDMSSSTAKSQQIIRILLQEFKNFHSKSVKLNMDSSIPDHEITVNNDGEIEDYIANDSEKQAFENALDDDEYYTIAKNELTFENDEDINNLYEFDGNQIENDHELPNKDETLKENATIPGMGKSLKCETCDKHFSFRQSLKKHKLIHSGEKPYQCNYCAKSFRHSNTLKNHERIHRGEKPFSCNDCSKSFTDITALKVHGRIHTGEKPYQCKHCDKRFRQFKTVRDHERIHTGHKPHMCKTCGETFTQSVALRYHEKKHS